MLKIRIVLNYRSPHLEKIPGKPRKENPGTGLLCLANSKKVKRLFFINSHRKFLLDSILKSVLHGFLAKRFIQYKVNHKLILRKS